MQKLTRRNVLKVILVTGAGSILAACSSPAASAQNGAAQNSAAPASVNSAQSNAQAPAANSTSNNADTSSTGNNSAATNSAPGAGAPPAATISAEDQATLQELVALMLGTLKLSGTSNAVTKDQAAGLIPLWQEYQTLSQSMRPNPGQRGQGQTQATPVAAETSQLQTKLSDLVTRIQAAMTADQLKAIDDMQITKDNMQSIITELGITQAGPGQGGGQPSDANGQQGQQAPQGTPPADQGNGQPPNGGPGMGRGGMMVPPGLVDALIAVLQKIS